MRANAAAFAGSGGSTANSAYNRATSLIDQARNNLVNNAYKRANHNITRAYPANSYGTLRMGSRGDSVKKLQKYLGITADGIFGNQTLSAVRNYQQSHGLGVDGIVGNNTWRTLLNGGPVRQSAPSKSSVPSYRVSSSHSGGGGGISSKAPSVKGGGAAPSIAPIDFNKFKWTEATLADLAKKYGVDYSMEAAKRMAEAQALTQKNALNTQQKQNTNQHQEVLKQLTDALNSGLANTDQQYFLKGLDQQQQLADNGINAGLAQDANLRLAMNKQNAIGDLSNTNQQQVGQENNRYTTSQSALDKALADLSTQTTANAQDIYNSRLQQAMAQLNSINSQRQQDTLARLQAALSQRGQNIDLKQLQEQMAWNVYNLGQNIGYQNSLGFNQGSGGGGKLPGNYQQDLATAARLEGIPQNQLGAFNWIIQHESSFNPNAKNPNSSAYGYGQFLNQTIANYDRKTGLHYRNSSVDQLREAYRYMVDRYGSPARAMLEWQKKGWY